MLLLPGCCTSWLSSVGGTCARQACVACVIWPASHMPRHFAPCPNPDTSSAALWLGLDRCKTATYTLMVVCAQSGFLTQLAAMAGLDARSALRSGAPPNVAASADVLETLVHALHRNTRCRGAAARVNFAIARAGRRLRSSSVAADAGEGVHPPADPARRPQPRSSFLVLPALQTRLLLAWDFCQMHRCDLLGK